MRHKEVIYLISETESQDDIGNVITEKKERKIYANQYDVSSSEFYNAGVNGIKPEKSFSIYSFEYLGEELLKYNGNIYEVVRTSTRGERTTLICERSVAGG